MINVGAYIDLPKWESTPLHEGTRWVKGSINTQSSEGLEVTWAGEPPEGAQVYVEWTPRVFAVWEEEEIEDDDGTETESAGSEPVEELDAEPGQPGDLAGEEPGSGPEEPEEVGGAPL